VLARPPGLRARRDAAPMLLSAGQQSVVDISCPPVTQQQTPQQRRVDDGTDAQPLHVRVFCVYLVGGVA